MPLVLQPRFSDMSRDEIERHLEGVRARRLSAIVEYHAGVNAKLRGVAAKWQARITREYEMLAIDIGKLDKLDEKVVARLAKLEEYMQEFSRAHEQMIPEIENGTEHS